MYIQPEVILEQYELEIMEINKGRGNFCCNTAQGNWCLVPYVGTQPRAEELGELLRELKQAGVDAEQICRTKEGHCVSVDESGNRYLLKELVQGSECQTSSFSDIKSATETIARMHKALSNLEGVNLPKVGQLELMEKRTRELGKIQNYIQKKNQKNKFEVLFRNNYQSFREEANCAMKIALETEPYVALQPVHGELTQHNVICVDGAWRVINYEHLRLGVRCADLANFMRKVLEKNDWNQSLGSEMLITYENILSMDAQEKQLLKALLMYPEKFWKVANHYYNSHKAWVSGRDIEKLEQVLEKQERKQAFLNNVFSF